MNAFANTSLIIKTLPENKDQLYALSVVQQEYKLEQMPSLWRTVS